MSIFFICSIAFMTREDFSASASWSISASTVGTTCQDTPYLSLSQPHCCKPRHDFLDACVECTRLYPVDISSTSNHAA
jgi:hypothetical protein